MMPDDRLVPIPKIFLYIIYIIYNIYIFINLYIKKINIIEEILKIVIIILIDIDNFLKRNIDFSINKN
jgi:hypothetical protein